MDKTVDLKFGQLRRYLSVIDRLSICMLESLDYENYRYLRDVPEKYDDYYVYGIGRIESEFKIAEEPIQHEVQGHEINDRLFFAQCIEIMLSEKPKEMILQDMQAEESVLQKEELIVIG